MVKPIYIKHKTFDHWVTRHDHTNKVIRAEVDLIKEFQGDGAGKIREIMKKVNLEWVEITEQAAFALFPQLRTAIFPEVTAASDAWQYGDAW